MSTLKSKEEEPEYGYSTVVAYIRFQANSVLAPSDSVLCRRIREHDSLVL